MSYFTSLGFGSAIQPAGPTRISCDRSLRNTRAGNWDGPPNRGSPRSKTSPTTRYHGANISAKAFATLLPGSIPESGVTGNSHSELVIKPAGPSGFVKPFVTVQ